MALCSKGQGFESNCPMQHQVSNHVELGSKLLFFRPSAWKRWTALLSLFEMTWVCAVNKEGCVGNVKKNWWELAETGLF